MNKKFLNKNTSCFFNQILPENILSISKSKKKRNRRNYIFNNYNSSIKESRDRARIHGSNQSKNKSENMKRAEAQIVRDFLSDLAQQKERLDDYIKEKVTAYIKARSQSVPMEKRSSSINYTFASNQSYKGSAFASITDANFFPIMSIEQIRNVLVSNRIEKRGGSELKSQLLESRKIRILYGGLSSRQLQRNLQRARTLPGGTSNNLLHLLESRLDVVLERCAFFTSVQSARQFILHKKVKINSKVINMPGYQLKPGDIIQVLNSKDFFRKKEKSKKSRKDTIANANLSIDSTALNVTSNNDVINAFKNLSDTFAFANACIGIAYALNLSKNACISSASATPFFTSHAMHERSSCNAGANTSTKLANFQFSQKERTNKHFKGYYSLLCGLLRLEKSFFSLPWKEENLNKISFSNLSPQTDGLHTFATANVSTAASEALKQVQCITYTDASDALAPLMQCPSKRKGEYINSTNPSEVLALLNQVGSTPPITPVQVMHLHNQIQWALDASKTKRNLLKKSIEDVLVKHLVENSALLLELEKKAIFFKPFFAHEKESYRNYKYKNTLSVNDLKQSAAKTENAKISALDLNSKYTEAKNLNTFQSSTQHCISVANAMHFQTSVAFAEQKHQLAFAHANARLANALVKKCTANVNMHCSSTLFRKNVPNKHKQKQILIPSSILTKGSTSGEFDAKQSDKLIQTKNAVQLYYLKRFCYEKKFCIKNSEKLEKRSFIDLYLNGGHGTPFRTFQDARLDVRAEHSKTVASKQRSVIDSTLFDQRCDKIRGYKHRFLKPFYNQCFYWLELRKKMLLQKKNQKDSRKNYKAEKKNTHGYSERKTKALHLEISYQSLSAIFLYPPQRVHLPALIDIELLVKNL